jgi:hypothetical protein
VQIRQEFPTERHSSTGRGMIFLGTIRCDPCSYTIAMAHRSAIVVVSTSKSAGGLTGNTGASANVNGYNMGINLENFLTVCMPFSVARKTSLTNRALDSARRSAPLATFSRVATLSRL